jgi:hypothetical protein
MDIFDEWFNDLKNQSDRKWNKSIRVHGVCRKRSGPVTPYAEVTLDFFPSEEFEVVNLLGAEINQLPDANDWYKGIVYGVIDVMLPFPNTPIKSIGVSIVEINFNERDSTHMAFRLAARDAAFKALEVYKKS